MRFPLAVTNRLVVLFSAALAVWAAASPPAVDVMLVLDRSGSMVANDPQRLLGEAAVGLITRLDEADAVGLVLFGTRASVARPLSQLTQEQRATLAEQIRHLRYDDRWTNLAQGLERGIYELRATGRETKVKSLIFLTDGVMDTGSKDQDAKMSEWLHRQLLQDAKDRKIRIFSVAIGDKADFQLLQEMSQVTGGEYFRAERADDLSAVFAAILKGLKSPIGISISKSDGLQESGGRENEEKGVQSAPQILPLLVVAGVVVVGLLVALFVARSGGQSRSDKLDVARAAGATTLPVQPTLPNASQAAPTISVPVASLVEMFGDHRSYRITKSEFSIGRLPENDIVVNDAHFSRNHARIAFREGAFYLVDLGSGNGSSVNNQPVVQEKQLWSGAVIQLDKLKYTFVLDLPSDGATVLRDEDESFDGEELDEPLPTEVIGSPYSRAIGGQFSCREHSSVNAIGNCSKCGKPICRACALEDLGVLFCKTCRPDEAQAIK